MYLNSPFLGNSGVLFTFLGRNELKYAGFLFTYIKNLFIVSKLLKTNQIFGYEEKYRNC